MCLRRNLLKTLWTALLAVCLPACDDDSSSSRDFVSTGPARVFTVDACPSFVVTADLNADGLPDIITANSDADTLSVLLNQGDGLFGPRNTLHSGPGTAPVSVATGDFNGDGLEDIVTANSGSENVTVLKNLGNGAFALVGRFSTGADTIPVWVAVADLAGDSKPDIVTANSTTNDVTVLVNLGDDLFGRVGRGQFDTGEDTAPVSVAVADFDVDSDMDIVTANSGTNDVAVLVNQGNGVFLIQPTGRFATGNDTVPAAIAVADLDGDGRTDIVTANSTPDKVSILLNQGDAVFALQRTGRLQTGTTAVSVAITDVDDDGLPDVVTANSGSDDVSILVNQGAAVFLSTSSVSTDTGPVSIAAADVDSDGIPDFITANCDANSVSVLPGDG